MYHIKLWICSILFAVSFHQIIGAEKNTILCNIASWSYYRPNQGKFTIRKDVDVTLCTHLVYQFMGINETTSKIKSRDEYTDFIQSGKGVGLLNDFAKLKEKNRDLKVMVGIGGWGEGSEKFSNIVASASKRNTFIESIVQFIKQHKLDGVDIVWQHPTDRGGVPEDKENFVTLIRELREKINDNRKVISLVIASKQFLLDPGYDLAGLSQYADFLSIYAFDYGGPWDGRTGVNAPLSSDNDLNVQYTVDYLLENGAVAGKLLLGVAAYGHSYNLESLPGEDDTHIGLQTDGGFISPWTREKGLIGYNEVCNEFATKPGWKEYWDDVSKTPYGINEKKFVSFDNQRSVIEKMKLVIEKGLGGAMVWTLDLDDFKGVCKSRYPLIRAIKNQLNFGEGGDLITPGEGLLVLQNTTVVSHNWG